MINLDRSVAFCLPLILTALTIAHPAAAQRADENATKAAEDGFGKSVGDESIGIYASGDVRGFSANDAGNSRIEGLYFNEAGGITDVVVSGSTVRLGLTAFGYPFPAPTGIVDTELRRAGKDTVVSVRLNSGEYLGEDITVDAAVPVTDRFSVNADFGLYDDKYANGADAWFVSYGGVARWRPIDSLELMGFFARYDFGDEEQGPVVYTSGNFLPKRVERRKFYGQDWADWAGHSQNYGGTAKLSLGEWQLAAGLFNSRFVRDDYASAYFSGVNAQGVGEEYVVSGKDQRTASTSGEVRLSRVFTEAERRHRVVASFRGRRTEADYGGFDVHHLGTGTIGVPDPQPEPEQNYGPLTHDRVRQTSYALGYELAWAGAGELNLGLTRMNYRKTVAKPGLAEEERNDREWLWNAALALTPTDRLTLYAGATRGLEESGTAPGSAVNRDEALPALRTRQEEAGLRYRLPGGMQLVAGVFDIRKPYFEIDSRDGVYKTLGTVKHQGVELSLSGQPVTGLNVVTGAVLLRPRVTGLAVEEGRLHRKPIGRTGTLLDVSLDYRLPFWQAASVDLRMVYEGKRTARANSALYIPERATIDLGWRYRMVLGSVPATLRVQLRNVTDVYGWKVQNGGGFTVTHGRRAVVTLTADF